MTVKFPPPLPVPAYSFASEVQITQPVKTIGEAVRLCGWFGYSFSRRPSFLFYLSFQCCFSCEHVCARACGCDRACACMSVCVRTRACLCVCVCVVVVVVDVVFVQVTLRAYTVSCINFILQWNLTKFGHGFIQRHHSSPPRNSYSPRRSSPSEKNKKTSSSSDPSPASLGSSGPQRRADRPWVTLENQTTLVSSMRPYIDILSHRKRTKPRPFNRTREWPDCQIGPEPRKFLPTDPSPVSRTREITLATNKSDGCWPKGL